MKNELAQLLVRGLKDAGVDFVSYLPETRLSQIVPLIRDDPAMELIPASSEQEAVTIAVGATLGGKQGAVYMENTGVYVSSYSLLVIGKHTVPVLEGLGIEYQIIEDGQKLENKIRDAVRAANAQRAPYALLFAGEFSE
jgi:sulfopyruvate decarboxylase TPP-binding subunit